ncbi:hypothetical protein [Companilactobacillus zhongbaensis]|uniref:hypothetical protein n=1 Tax=Companilactobacillus zhongbaensis TaxID=2486009 RepID=UPI000F76FB26|nr:hypothetical protein [Companilactobacillus zhongbaensis]
MKYEQQDIDEIHRLIDECMKIPDIKNEKHIVKLLKELEHKVDHSKRFKNSLGLRKEAAIYSRKHKFQLPECFNELLVLINDIYMGKNSKHRWFNIFHNLD